MLNTNSKSERGIGAGMQSNRNRADIAVSTLTNNQSAYNATLIALSGAIGLAESAESKAQSERAPRKSTLSQLRKALTALDSAMQSAQTWRSAFSGAPRTERREIFREYENAFSISLSIEMLCDEYGARLSAKRERKRRERQERQESGFAKTIRLRKESAERYAERFSAQLSDLDRRDCIAQNLAGYYGAPDSAIESAWRAGFTAWRAANSAIERLRANPITDSAIAQSVRALAQYGACVKALENLADSAKRQAPSG